MRGGCPDGAGEQGKQALRPWFLIGQRNTWNLTTKQTLGSYSAMNLARFHPTSLPSLQTRHPVSAPEAPLSAKLSMP